MPARVIAYVAWKALRISRFEAERQRCSFD